MTQVVGVGIVNLVSRYEVLTQEPVIVVEQPVIELLNKMINKGQVEGSVPILLWCNGRYVGSVTLDCRYPWHAGLDCLLLCTLQ